MLLVNSISFLFRFRFSCYRKKIKVMLSNFMTMHFLSHKIAPTMECPAFEKYCSLNIQSMIKKIFLFYCRNVSLFSVIYPSLIGLSSLSKCETCFKQPLSNICKVKWKQQERFPFILDPSNYDTWTCSCIFPLGRIEFHWINHSW